MAVFLVLWSGRAGEEVEGHNGTEDQRSSTFAARCSRKVSSLVEAAVKSGLAQGHLPCTLRGWEEGPGAGVGGRELTKSAPECEAVCSLQGGRGQEQESPGCASCWEGLEKAGDGD